MQFADQIDQLLDAATQAIQFPNHQSIAVAKNFLRLTPARTVGPRTAYLVLKDL